MRHVAYSYRNDPEVPAFKDDKPIVVFDGHCVLCSRWARTILKHDKHHRMRLLAAQSPLGEALYAHYQLKSDDYDTNLLIYQGRVRLKSDGSIAMCEIMGGLWKLFTLMRLIPLPIRDRVYEFIAKRRIKWFGANDTCFLPPPNAQDRFLP